MAKWKEPKPAKVDLRTIDKPFGELDERTQRRLEKADAKGWPLQTRGFSSNMGTGLGWSHIAPSGWYREETIRLNPSFTPPPKRRVVWIVNGTVFFTKKGAKIAYPGEKLPKFKECRE